MITMTILGIILTLVTLIAFAALTIGGTIGVVLFSDLIVCVGVIILLVRLIRRRKRK